MKFLKTLGILMILGVVLNNITRLNVYLDQYNKWNNVTIVTDIEDTKGHSKLEIEQITGKTTLPLGNRFSIAKWAKNDLKKEANKIGATMVLISKDDLKAEDLKNFQIVGIPYK